MVVVPLLAGLVAMLAASCAPAPTAPKGIVFNPPTVGYVGQQYVPKATAPNSLPISFSLDATSTGCSLVASSGPGSSSAQPSSPIASTESDDARHVDMAVHPLSCAPSSKRAGDNPLESHHLAHRFCSDRIRFTVAIGRAPSQSADIGDASRMKHRAAIVIPPPR